MAMDLGKQYGPLPLGAWIIVVGSGVGIALWARSHQSTEPSAVRAPGVDSGVGLGGTPGVYTELTPVVPAGGVAPAITTNEQWASAAITWLIAMGYPAVVADSAMRKYITGTGGYSAQEYMMVTLALAHLGPPPSPLPPDVTPPPALPGPITNTPPPPATPPTSTAPRYFTVTKWPLPGSSLWTIALIVYGNPKRWTEIYGANRGTIGNNPNIIKAGTKLLIP
jgi:nucleoid-associated protein YgaU